jgi:hypothetical protein
MGTGFHDAYGIVFSRNVITKMAFQNPCTCSRGFHELPGIAFLGHEIAEYAFTGGYVTMSRRTKDA